MSQARRQRRQMYKQFGLLGNKSPQAKQMRDFLKKMRHDVNFQETNEMTNGDNDVEIIEAEEINEIEENDPEQES